MTVLQAIQRGVDFLAKKGVDSPRLQAELLLGHVLKMPRMKLYLDFERGLTETEQSELRELLKRRGQREPLQHILGSACFCGLEIAVNPNVLIPRPETEMLAEYGWKFLKTVADRKDSATPTALDFGTGSGCLAIALATHCPAARFHALDISNAALEVAGQNAARHAVDSRIQFLVSDAFSALSAGARFDLIVSNPPYIPASDIPGLEPEVRDHDPRAALDGGADGLDFYRLLAREAASRLHTSGRVMVEFGDGQQSAVRAIFEGEKWIAESIWEDYNRKPRFLAARRQD